MLSRMCLRPHGQPNAAQQQFRRRDELRDVLYLSMDPPRCSYAASGSVLALQRTLDSSSLHLT